MIRGLNHITLATSDLDRSFTFYERILGARPLARWRKGAYLLLGNVWLCLTLDLKRRAGPLPEYSHIGFDVTSNDFEELANRIESGGAALWQTNTSEGQSLYFLDPDGHKLEIHVGDWRSRLKSMKEDPWDDATEFFGEAP